MEENGDESPIVVNDLKGAENYLRAGKLFTTTVNLINYLFSHPYWNCEISMRQDVSQKLKIIYDVISKNYAGDKLKLKASIHLIVFNHIYDSVIAIIRECFKEEDNSLFERCKELCEMSISPEQIGAPEDFAIPLTAGLVELAALDNHKSPMEKMQCLSNTYDLIYAETKSALIDHQIQFDKDFIAIVDRRDVLPILMTTIIKAKPLHLYSSFYYIFTFLNCNPDVTNIALGDIVEAAKRLNSLKNESIKIPNEKMYRSLDLAKVVQLSMDYDKPKKKVSLIDNYIENLVQLILTSTLESQKYLSLS